MQVQAARLQSPGLLLSQKPVVLVQAAALQSLGLLRLLQNCNVSANAMDTCVGVSGGRVMSTYAGFQTLQPNAFPGLEILKSTKALARSAWMGTWTVQQQTCLSCKPSAQAWAVLQRV